jgi:uncharacterized coiled-coil protein SlyX
MDDANLNRMFGLIQQELVRLRGETSAGFAAARSGMVEGFDAIRVETAERFLSVMDRLDLIEYKVAKSTATVEEMRQELVAVKNEVYKLDDRIDHVQMSVNGLADDMRQRFRVMNERLSTV